MSVFQRTGWEKGKLFWESEQDRGADSSTFDISVDFLLRVQVLKALQDLAQDSGDLRLVQSTGLQLWGERERTGKEEKEKETRERYGT